ncbi:MAG: hypothetical protein K2Q45_06540 [Nitrosomonas sp.]|nr:hypothetical protein [Nitrosomonas sp.]
MDNDGFQKRWYEIRDTFFGTNFKAKDRKKAFILACGFPEHPEARWFASVLGFQFDQGTDARSLCFAGIVNNDLERIRRSANMGYAFAQVWLVVVSVAGGIFLGNEESIYWAQKAANQGERDGFFLLYSLKHCLKSLQRACALGHVESMVFYALDIRLREPLKSLEWLIQAAHCGNSLPLIIYVPKCVRETEPKKCMMIGRAVRGKLQTKDIIFNHPVPHSVMYLFRMANVFFEDRLVQVRAAVDAWTIIARRLNINRDMRKYIGEMVWKKRNGKWLKK